MLPSDRKKLATYANNLCVKLYYLQPDVFVKEILYSEYYFIKIS